MVHIYKVVTTLPSPGSESLSPQSHILTTTISKYGFKSSKATCTIQLPLSTDLDLERDLWRSTEAGDFDLLEEARF